MKSKRPLDSLSSLSDVQHFEESHQLEKYQRTRVVLRSFSRDVLNEALTVFAAYGKVSLVRLPTRKKLYTVLRSPHVNKKARDQYHSCEYAASVLLHYPLSDSLRHACYALEGVRMTFHRFEWGFFPSCDI